jgi:aminopeptidase
MTAPVAAAAAGRKMAEHAYKAGAGLVTTLYSDEEVTLARYRYGQDHSFDRAAGWLYDGMAKAFGENAARLGIYGDNPMLLAEQDPAKVARANKANSMAYRPALEKITGFDINWNDRLLSRIRAGPSWCSRTTPRMSPWQTGRRHLRRLARRQWRRPDRGLGEHNASLHKRTATAERAQFSTPCISRARAPTLPSGWPTATPGWAARAGQERHHLQPEHPDRGGLHHAARARVDGHVRSTKPLSHQGTLIDNIEVRFEGGKHRRGARHAAAKTCC